MGSQEGIPPNESEYVGQSAYLTSFDGELSSHPVMNTSRSWKFSLYERYLAGLPLEELESEDSLGTVSELDRQVHSPGEGGVQRATSPTVRAGDDPIDPSFGYGEGQKDSSTVKPPARTPLRVVDNAS